MRVLFTRWVVRKPVPEETQKHASQVCEPVPVLAMHQLSEYDEADYKSEGPEGHDD